MSRGLLAAAIAVALIPFVLFADAVLGRVVFYERDVLAYWIPSMEAFVRAISEGAWPLWDPLTAFGRPILADPSMQIAYPPTWLNLLLPPGVYYTSFVVAHCAWAAVGMQLLGRAWGLRLGGASWAAACWVMSGAFLSAASLYHHFASAAWIAWVLLAVEGVITRPGRRSSALLGCAAAGAALAGSADVCVMTGAAAAARLVFALVARDERAALRPSSLAGALAASCALGGLLSAVQWWPTMAYLATGSRGAAGAASAMYWSVHPATLLDVLFPGLVAELPLREGLRAALFESRRPLLRSLYVGIPALGLAGAALAGRWRLRWLVAALALAYLVGALGRFAPLYPALASLPVVRLLRFPMKLAIPATFFLCVLSGAGLDALRGQWSDRQRRWMILLTVLAFVAGSALIVAALEAERVAAALAPSLAAGADVTGRLRQTFARAAILALAGAAAFAARAAGRGAGWTLVALALALADLGLAARGAVRLAPAALVALRPPVLDAFARPEDHRLFSFGYPLDWLNAQFTRPPAGWDPEWAWALGHTQRLAPPIPTRWRLAGSYDGDFTGLTSVALTRLSAVVVGARTEALGLRLLRMGSVTDVVCFEDSLYGLPPRAEFASVYARPVRVFAVPDSLPRAVFVSGVRVYEPAAEDSVLLESDFDAGREVALEAGTAPPRAASGVSAGRAEIVARRSDRLTVSVSAREAGVAVVTETYDPGWRAWVDGAPAPLWRANAIFRGVPVGQGDHVVEMRYRPPSAAWGAAATALGIAVTGILLRRRTA